MSDRSRLSRGDKRRNARIARLREIVTRDNAVLGLDLASSKQVVVVTDHDSQVLARRTFRCSPGQLGPALAWALAEATKAGFRGLTLACEPTGHRWRVVGELAAEAGIAMVCVQPMLVARAREAEDFTRDKSDDKDAVLIARLTCQLHVYVPEVLSPVWARLRHLGARRVEQVTRRSAARQQVRDLLECVWPQVLGCASKPFDAATWLAAMRVAGCDPEKVRGHGTLAAFIAAVAAELPAWGARRVYRPILAKIWAAAAAPVSLPGQRAAAIERAGYVLGDLAHHAHACGQVETEMTAVIDELGYTALIESFPGISVVGAAAILAETGDLARFDSARALVKHAGLCPRENASGTYAGKTSISRRGRPKLRLAVYRAAFAATANNEVYAARYTHLTTRKANPLTNNQARVAIGAALLRQLYIVIVTNTTWDPAIAAGGTTKQGTAQQEAA
ncbi:IS110 family transposase [Gordonia sp. NPDC003422]